MIIRHPPSPLATATRRLPHAGTKWAIFLFATVCLAALATPAVAQSELVTVTRKAADLYGVRGDNVLLMTAGCEVYALATPARLLPDAGRMVLRFESAPADGSLQPARSKSETPTVAECELRDMVSPQVIPKGRYQVSLSLDSPDWYAIGGTNLLLRTVGCQRRSMNEPVVWFQPMEGKGVIEYRSGVACSSDGVFGSVRRQARSKAVAVGR